MRARIGSGLVILALIPLGILIWQRYWQVNFHEVVPGQIYRSAGPSGAKLGEWIEAYGLRTVVNLRDDRSFAEEARLVRSHGAVYLHRPFSDRTLPERIPFLALVDTLATLPPPLLIHCRAGADRTGVLSAVAGMAQQGWSFEEALSQLDGRFLHWNGSESAVEGVLLRYRRYADERDLDPGGFDEFRAWLREHYSHGPYLISVDAPDSVFAVPHTLHRLPLRIHNRTDMTIPCSSDSRQFRLVAYAGSAVDLMPDREYPPRLDLTQDIPPFGSIEVEIAFWTPREPGVHELRFDMVEEYVTWFAAQGSPEPIHWLVLR